MEDKDLLKLANIATVRQHINFIINGAVDRKKINLIQKVGRDLDDEFVQLLLSTPEKVEVLRAVSIESTTFEEPEVKQSKVNITEDEEDKVEPSLIRPKIKTSKKAIKK